MHTPPPTQQTTSPPLHTHTYEQCAQTYKMLLYICINTTSSEFCFWNIILLWNTELTIIIAVSTDLITLIFIHFFQYLKDNSISANTQIMVTDFYKSLYNVTKWWWILLNFNLSAENFLQILITIIWQMNVSQLSSGLFLSK